MVRSERRRYSSWKSEDLPTREARDMVTCIFTLEKFWDGDGGDRSKRQGRFDCGFFWFFRKKCLFFVWCIPSMLRQKHCCVFKQSSQTYNRQAGLEGTCNYRLLLNCFVTTRLSQTATAQNKTKQNTKWHFYVYVKRFVLRKRFHILQMCLRICSLTTTYKNMEGKTKYRF